MPASIATVGCRKRSAAMKKLMDPTMFKFLLVGVFNTLVGCGTMFLLYNLAGCSYWLSSAANYIHPIRIMISHSTMAIRTWQCSRSTA